MEPGGGESKTETKPEGPQTFTFHLPDGKSASIIAPRGTSTEQAWGYLTQQHPEYGRGQGQGGQSQTEAPTRDPDAPDPVGFVAGLGQGIADIPEAAGQMIQKGGEAIGVDPSRLVPGFVQRGAEALRRRAEASNAGQAGRLVSGLGAFALQPELGIGRAAQAIPYVGRALGPAANVATRSTLPAVLQPTDTKDPNFWSTKGWQALLGTGLGETLQQISRAAGIPLKRWAGEDKQAADAAAHNQQVQQAVDRMNQRNQLDYAGQQAQHQAAVARQLDLPRQATQDVLNDARGLIGLRPLEYNLTRESAPQALREVGGELDRLYGRMSFDPNKGGWLANAQKVQQEIDSRLRQDPNAQALWDRVFQGKAFMPGLRAEAGAGAPVTGVAPATARGPGGQTFRMRSGTPTGDIQGPLGTRSGPVSGDQLSLLMSQLTKAQQQFGLEAQRGGGAIYGNIADGLAQMRKSIEGQLDRNFPALAEQRRLANQAYFLTSRVMEAVDVHGTATPKSLLEAFRKAEGDTRFGTDQRYADVKDRLARQDREHTTPIDAPRPPTPVRGPDPVPTTRADPRLPGAAVHMASHLVPGGHMSRAIAREVLRQGGRSAIERPLRGASHLGRAGPPVSALAGQSQSEPPQELVVTPSGASWRDIPTQESK